jgi:hypothetical protein
MRRFDTRNNPEKAFIFFRFEGKRTNRSVFEEVRKITMNLIDL